uniref:Replication protein A 70 kDa DNA-binding subunit B/D first OB fold domain-containing protein n=1 Tax=Ananas comosus var. bracteatus TaxID=296719 RepID=A0A6V7PDZ2_ANACO|nr:unnamed protein product [Ananas comosus var. bracteatus]
MEYVLLSDLSLQRQGCKIKVRICRLWESSAPFLKGDIFGLDCLMVDEKGYSLQATIRKKDVEELKSRLAEGNVYLIEKFNVIPSKKKFIVVERLYMIQINKWTSLTLVEENVDQIPLYSFKFLSFPHVENQRYNDTVLTDVFGRVTAVSEIAHKYVGQTLTPLRNLEIQDLEMNVLSVTLWDKFALEFDDSGILDKDGHTSLIIILAGMTVRSFKEKINLSTCSASKIYINLQIPEVTQFVDRLQPMSTSIQRINTSQQQSISPQEEILANRKNIAGLLSLDLPTSQNIKFTCEATIAEVDTSFGWWYKACYNCKSAIKTFDDSFWYKLNTIVEDGSGSANFTIFGRLAQDLIHIPAQNLATSVGSDKFTLHPLIKTIVGQKYIFQIVPDLHRFRTSAHSFKVLKIFNENLLIKSEEELPPTTQNEISKETSTSSSSPILDDDLNEIPTAKKRRLKRRLIFDEAPSTNEDKM